MNFAVNFGQRSTPFCPVMADYEFMGKTLDGLVRGPQRPQTKAECEVLQMVGLPGAGKTYWVTQHVRQHPKKLYNILGTNTLLEKMKVMGLTRQRNYHGRWEVLISKCTECFDVLMKIAAKRRRHYILDQTNVFPLARIRKMKDFKGYNCKTIVVVPDDQEFKRR